MSDFSVRARRVADAAEENVRSGASLEGFTSDDFDAALAELAAHVRTANPQLTHAEAMTVACRTPVGRNLYDASTRASKPVVEYAEPARPVVAKAVTAEEYDEYLRRQD